MNTSFKSLHTLYSPVLTVSSAHNRVSSPPHCLFSSSLPCLLLTVFSPNLVSSLPHLFLAFTFPTLFFSSSNCLYSPLLFFLYGDLYSFHVLSSSLSVSALLFFYCPLNLFFCLLSLSSMYPPLYLCPPLLYVACPSHCLSSRCGPC